LHPVRRIYRQAGNTRGPRVKIVKFALGEMLREDARPTRADRVARQARERPQSLHEAIPSQGSVVFWVLRAARAETPFSLLIENKHE